MNWNPQCRMSQKVSQDKPSYLYRLALMLLMPSLPKWGITSPSLQQIYLFFTYFHCLENENRKQFEMLLLSSQLYTVHQWTMPLEVNSQAKTKVKLLLSQLLNLCTNSCLPPQRRLVHTIQKLCGDHEDFGSHMYYEFHISWACGVHFWSDHGTYGEGASVCFLMPSSWLEISLGGIICLVADADMWSYPGTDWQFNLQG